ncbi:BON domain-containing protein [Rhodoplanes sp. Z2-YC6860]|uniref:BON domain-containing protein n=1 Tax=Rhodoplanes sp. Z2-YC6860 TaxID=674703 RepID=UPI00078E4F77|nr:BON domain-containing protein [Rhodoplanes sp. Z2-YC6860]AMN38524.1 transport-associated protein [Rhodoplanes sp. Z2-YC6860]
MSDLQLRQNVLDELEFDPTIDAAHIGVTADAGVITLTGYVKNYPEKTSAVEAAQRVRGVLAVADEIEVRYPANKKSADDEIAKRAVDILEWDVSVPSGSVDVTIRDGWITLGGQVEWYLQKKAAENAVRKLSGVRGVTNDIAIQPKLKADNIKKLIEDALERHAHVEAAAIRVSVRDKGVVLLEGTVENWSERQAVENAAWSAPGVRSVEDRLRIS